MRNEGGYVISTNTAWLYYRCWKPCTLTHRLTSHAYWQTTTCCASGNPHQFEMLHHRTFSLKEKLSISVSEQSKSSVLQDRARAAAGSNLQNGALQIFIYMYTAWGRKMHCCDMAMMQYWPSQKKQQLYCAHHRFTVWVQTGMTQDCQTQQLPRQQDICQCQRPVTLHLIWQCRKNVRDLQGSCNTQLLVTWVHRTPRITVRIHAQRFSRAAVSLFFWLS